MPPKKQPFQHAAAMPSSLLLMADGAAQKTAVSTRSRNHLKPPVYQKGLRPKNSRFNTQPPARCLYSLGSFFRPKNSRFNTQPPARCLYSLGSFFRPKNSRFNTQPQPPRKPLPLKASTALNRQSRRKRHKASIAQPFPAIQALLSS